VPVPDVRADPEKLRQFASALSRSSSQLESIARQLRRSLETTGWQDSERQRFEQDFQATVHALSGFTERLRDTYVPQLRKKADALDRFRE
jgi:Proteins of 100 residues with WXG